MVRNWAEPTGSVSLHGGVWNARRSPSASTTNWPSCTRGDRVVIERLTGLTLRVRPAEEWELMLRSLTQSS